MPLIIISGYPSSGKSYRAQQLATGLRERITASTDPRVQRMTVHVVDNESLNLSRTVYSAARPEKDARATEASAIKRLMTRDAIVIADGLNYIKGFRYQLFCEAKAVKTPCCVVHVGTPPDKCRELHAQKDTTAQYGQEDFENLIFRYEEPNGMNRWDSPLFTVPYYDENPPYDDIFTAVCGTENGPRVVKPNQATILTPAAPSNFLYELSKATQDVLTAVSEYQSNHAGEFGGTVSIAESETNVELPLLMVSNAQLQRLRRQFTTLNRSHTGLNPRRIRTLFVEYLNEELSNI